MDFKYICVELSEIIIEINYQNTYHSPTVKSRITQFLSLCTHLKFTFSTKRRPQAIYFFIIQIYLQRNIVYLIKYNSEQYCIHKRFIKLFIQKCHLIIPNKTQTKMKNKNNKYINYKINYRIFLITSNKPCLNLKY